MSKKYLSYLLVISLTLNISFAAATGYLYLKRTAGWVSPLGYKIAHGHHFFDKFDLDEKQREEMIETASRYHGLIDNERHKIRPLRTKLIEEVKKEKPDPERITSLIDSINGVQRTMQTATIEHLLESKEILGAAQLEKVLDLIKKAMEQE